MIYEIKNHSKQYSAYQPLNITMNIAFLINKLTISFIGIIHKMISKETNNKIFIQISEAPINMPS